MNKAILSTQIPQFAKRLRLLEYQIIPAEQIACRMNYERYHADLQCLILDDTAFVLSCCPRLCEALSGEYAVVECSGFDGAYPYNTALSAVKLGKKLLCRFPSLHDRIKEYCRCQEYELIHVNQGYTKCACAVAGDNAVITADNGIVNTLKDTDVDVLQIGQGSVLLEGAESGFIGGASGYDKNRHILYFCGSIERHPDYVRIKDFCAKHHTTLISLSDEPLADIGGIVFV